MKPLKKSTGILAAVILIVMISGLLLANQMIDHLENNITTDYTKVYHDDLARLLGEGWTVLAKENGYTATPFDSPNIYTWEIGYKDKEGQERSILLSNFKDRSMEHPFGYCIEKNFQTMTGEVYARDVISPVIPAVCWQPEYWIRFLNYYVSGDHITDRPYEGPASTAGPWAEVTLKTSPLLDESNSSMDWENPESAFPLYDIDYAGIFKRKPDLWYLSVSLDFYLEDMDPAEYEEKAGALEETAEQVLARLNEYTGHTVNAEIIYPTGSDQKGASYHHWYVINGDIVDQSVSDIQLPIFGVIDPMYNNLKKFYHPEQGY